MSDRLQDNVVKLCAAGHHFVYVVPPQGDQFSMGCSERGKQVGGTLPKPFALGRGPVDKKTFQCGVDAVSAAAAVKGIARFALRVVTKSCTESLAETNEPNIYRAMCAHVERAGSETIFEGAGMTVTLIPNPSLPGGGALVMPALPCGYDDAMPIVNLTRRTVQAWLDHYYTPLVQEITDDSALRAVIPTREQAEGVRTKWGTRRFAAEPGDSLFAADGTTKLAHFAAETAAKVGQYPEVDGFVDLAGQVREFAGVDEVCGGGFVYRHQRYLLAAYSARVNSNARFMALGFRVGLALG